MAHCSPSAHDQNVLAQRAQWDHHECPFIKRDVAKNLARSQQVFDEVNASSINADELEQARNKVASRIVLRGERPMGRLSSLGGNWMYRHEYRSIAADLQTIRSLTLKDIRKVLNRFPITMTTTVGVGPLKDLG